MLWEDNEDLVRACREHPFVRGLADGTLDLEVFKRYLAQDAFYLEAFFRAYALAAARCEGRHDTALAFHRMMGGVVEELKLHEGLARRLGIDLGNVRPYPATTAYVEFLLDTAWHHDLGTILAAMTPCLRLYAHLGQMLADSSTEHHPYRDWIETYSSEETDRLAAEIEQLLDELAEDGPEVRSAYRHALQCELDFFSAPFEDGQ
jgi:thiaminase/transcriptional activator TenA